MKYKLPILLEVFNENSLIFRPPKKSNLLSMLCGNFWHPDLKCPVFDNVGYMPGLSLPPQLLGICARDLISQSTPM